jgi:hypothetical protein
MHLKKAAPAICGGGPPELVVMMREERWRNSSISSLCTLHSSTTDSIVNQYRETCREKFR